MASPDAAIPMPPDFDPWTQPVYLLTKDGYEVEVNMEIFNFYRLWGVRMGINYGTQIGASILLLLVLFLLTRSSKKGSSLFIINALCLITNILRCILASCYLTSTMWNPYTQLVQDWRRVATTDLATIVATNIMHLIVTILVMTSLSTQVWVACITTKPSQRYLIMGFTSLMALSSISCKCAVVVITSQAALNFEGVEEDSKIITASYVCQALAIGIYSCVFTWKLGHAIIQRRRLNMPQFGPLQIIFIMGCQTMIVPAIFSVLQFSKDMMEIVPEIGNQSLTVVCIFLPLSAVWAGVVNDSNIAHRGQDAHIQILKNEFGRSQTRSTKGESESTTAINKSTHSSTVHPKSSEGIDCYRLSSSAEEGRMMDDNIYVSREFRLHTENASGRV